MTARQFNDGAIFVQIDDEEAAYLKVLMDEVFGRHNFINTVSVNMKNIAGASGGGEDKKLKKILNIFISMQEIMEHSLILKEYLI